jgi:hypothetical protein
MNKKTINNCLGVPFLLGDKGKKTGLFNWNQPTCNPQEWSANTILNILNDDWTVKNRIAHNPTE